VWSVRSGSDPTAGGHQTAVTRHGCERGNSSKGKRRREERGPTHPGVDHDHFGGRRPRRASVWVSGSVPWWRVSAKRGEPQDWQRDATSPQSFARRKPSRWCETTRAERGWTGGAVGPWLFGAAGFGSREGPGPGVDARWMCRWRGDQKSRTPREAGSWCPGASAPDRTARGPATVRKLHRRLERSGSAEEVRFAVPKRHPGDVLEGPGPVTVEGRGGRRKEPTDLPPRAARQRAVRRVSRRSRR
jgi:hypothetical protein